MLHRVRVAHLASAADAGAGDGEMVAAPGVECGAASRVPGAGRHEALRVWQPAAGVHPLGGVPEVGDPAEAEHADKEASRDKRPGTGAPDSPDGPDGPDGPGSADIPGGTDVLGGTGLPGAALVSRAARWRLMKESTAAIPVAAMSRTGMVE